MTQRDDPADRDGPTITRRRLLAAVGTSGVAVGAARHASGRTPAYTHYTYARSLDPDEKQGHVRVAWYETYNGERVDRSDESLTLTNETSDSWNQSAATGQFVDGPTVPLFALDNLLPGDRGTVVVGLTAEQGPAAVWLRLHAPSSTENGRNEPERKAGDSTAVVGELADALHVRVWYDVGVAGYGACNGRYDLDAGVDLVDEPLVAEGTLRTVSEALADGVPIAARDGTGGSGCLRNEPLCLGIEWWLDADIGNTIQGDGATFDLTFVGTACSVTTNPFGGESA